MSEIESRCSLPRVRIDTVLRVWARHSLYSYIFIHNNFFIAYRIIQHAERGNFIMHHTQLTINPGNMMASGGGRGIPCIILFRTIRELPATCWKWWATKKCATTHTSLTSSAAAVDANRASYDADWVYSDTVLRVGQPALGLETVFSYWYCIYVFECNFAANDFTQTKIKKSVLQTWQ